MSQDVDLVIVGGGLAGMSAAVRAGELGLQAVVLEQGDAQDYACNSRYSGGILHLMMLDPYRPSEELVEIAKKALGPDANEKLVRTMAGSGRKFIEWLQQQGIRFMRFNALESTRWCMAPPRALRGGLDWEGRGPDVALKTLERRFVDLGGTVRRGTTARSLRMVDGRCRGVVAETENGTVEFSAPYVLLADGGFQANRELYERYIGGRFDRVFQRGARTGVGAGLTMALAAGAAFAGAGHFYGHVLSAESLHNDRIWPYPELDAIATAGIVVDEEGRRVADEGRGGIFLANMLATSNAKKLFALFDAAIWEGPGSSARLPANPLLEVGGATIFRSDSIAGLAGKIRIPARNLADSLAAYNAAVAGNGLDALNVPRSTNVKAWPIGTAPFMAVEILPGITHTMAGIAIDEHAQVLRENGEPIPGLLAAGGTTGGIEGGRNIAYLGGLLKAGVFGLVAAERAHSLLRPAAAGDAASGAASSPATASSAAISVPGLRQYPLLHAIAHYGTAGSVILGVLGALFFAKVLHPVFEGYSPFISAALGIIIAMIGRAFVELVSLIANIFFPSQSR
jgi:fumarate reductase flavoprotein subunit